MRVENTLTKSPEEMPLVSGGVYSIPKNGKSTGNPKDRDVRFLFHFGNRWNIYSADGTHIISDTDSPVRAFMAEHRYAYHPEAYVVLA